MSDPMSRPEMSRSDVTTDAAGRSGETSGGATEAVEAVAEKAGELAAQATEQARHVIDDTKQQAREFVDRSTQDLRRQAVEQTGQAASAVRTLAERLGALAAGDTEGAGPLADFVREGQSQVSTWAARLDRGPDELLGEIRSFARRQPMMFLAAAGALGFAAGRLVRANTGANGNGHEASASAATATIRPAQPAAVTAGAAGSTDPYRTDVGESAR